MSDIDRATRSPTSQVGKSLNRTLLKAMSEDPLFGPAAAWRSLREQSPVLWSRVMRSHVVVGYEAAKSVLQSHEFDVAHAAWQDLVTPGWRINGGMVTWAKSFIQAPHETHAAPRKGAQSVLSPRRDEFMRACSQRHARLRASQLPTAKSGFDLVTNFAQPMALGVLADVLELSISDTGRLLTWATDFMRSREIGRSASLQRRSGEAAEHIEALSREVYEHPLTRSGVTGRMLDEIHDGRTWTIEERVSLLLTLIIAGFRTVQESICAAFVLVETHPTQRAQVVDDPSSFTESAAIETLRIAPPVQLVARMARTDMEVSRVAIQSGASVLVSIVAANRDPEVWGQTAEEMVLTRRPEANLTFASGAHLCLGAGLAKHEITAAVQAVYQRWPDFGLAVKPWRDYGANFSEFTELLCTVTRRARAS
ncbi:cytochrome P450 [Jatrophihabitans sp. GAS493]|uniref:cytochrome P450 n=1 Tax=Jatrophihabitans sp. GAS493 TaxID=1907575 RepID=UPI000BBF77BF|nr:cytochrome P450 [Jatrophihabitans sp. GAS493]SOD75055.1 cytochrome P450 [Jatrophihabitans sp. GAS493]